ncbi:3',5'-bisphosphate nucleotidase AHL-like [Bidens hawaiensis]|uniref:3',5'-bisphosphate nucleotidase AHL-like n=1 Tax=Bidens hawaiensis TaxID=980011 RepID=UPI0040499B47
MLMDAIANHKYAKELQVGVRVVQMACYLCQKLQKGSVGPNPDHVISKDDDSPVTVADWGVQAMISWMLTESFGRENVSIVAEEDTQTLADAAATSLLASVVATVNETLALAPRFGLKGPATPLNGSQVLDAISRCNSTGGRVGRHWVLDPVDGTLGFVRGDQYAVALALIDHGQVVVGVLGCPNYSSKRKLVNNNNNSSALESEGCVMYTSKGSGQAWMQPLVQGDGSEWPSSASIIRVSSIDNPVMATFCEPVEKANSNHSYSAGIAHRVGLRKQPLRVYSMVKYAAIARGDAEIYMKFAKTGYKEKIWDHAAGVLIVEEAGGVVTDAGGRPLDFSKGVYLEGLDRGIVACSGVNLHDKIIGAVYASWDSSNL